MTGIEHLDFEFAPFAEKAADLLIAPVRPYLPVLEATKGKPLSELTMPEALAWLAVGSYFAMVGIVAAQLAAGAIGVVLRGPAARR